MSRKEHRATLRIAIGFATAVLAVGLTACAGQPEGAGQSEGATDETITIGQLMPLSGPLAALGTQVSQGADVARALFNEAGGVNGAQIEWSVVDAPSEEAARQGAERLVNDGVKIVYGTYGSAQALAAIPVVARAGGIYWEEGASAAGITDQGLPGVFRVGGSAKTTGSTAVDFAATTVADTLGVDPESLTVGWAGVNGSYGQDALAGAKEAAEKHGMKFVLEAPYPGDATDLSSVALQIQQESPDILVLTSYPADGAILGRAMEATDIDPVAILGTGGIHSDPSWTEAMGSAGNGVFTVGTTTELNVDGLLPESQELYASYLDKMTELYPDSIPTGFTRYGFDGAWTLFQTLASADGLSTEDIISSAKAMDWPAGTLLNGDGLRFDENGQNVETSWFVSQWQNGELVSVFPDDLAIGTPDNIPLPAWDAR